MKTKTTYYCAVVNEQGASEASPNFRTQKECKNWLVDTWSDPCNLRASIVDEWGNVIKIKRMGYKSWERQLRNY